MTSNIGCFGLLLIFGFIVYLFIRRRKLTNELQAFFNEGHYLRRDQCPVPNPFVYTDAHVGCSDGELKPGMPYTLILGSRMTGAGKTASLHTFIGFYFPQQVNLSDEWLAGWKQKVAERGDAWAEGSGVEKMKKSWGLMGAPDKLPIRAIRVNDGVLIAWIGLHLRKQIEERIQDVLASFS
jgi:hypothetical protein